MGRMKSKLPIGPIIAGLVLIGVGIAYLLSLTMNFTLNWDLIWPWSLIAVGVLFLLQNWRANWWALIPLVMGIVFLARGFIPGLDVEMIWPIGIIALGLFFLLSAFARKGGQTRRLRAEQRAEDRGYERGRVDAEQRSVADVRADRDDDGRAEGTHERSLRDLDGDGHRDTIGRDRDLGRDADLGRGGRAVDDERVAEPVPARGGGSGRSLRDLDGDGHRDTLRPGDDRTAAPILDDAAPSRAAGPYDAAPTIDDDAHAQPSARSPYASGGSRLEDPNAPGFANGPSASRREDPNAPGFATGPSASRLEDPNAAGFENGPSAAGSTSIDGRPSA